MGAPLLDGVRIYTPFMRGASSMAWGSLPWPIQDRDTRAGDDRGGVPKGRQGTSSAHGCLTRGALVMTRNSDGLEGALRPGRGSYLRRADDNASDPSQMTIRCPPDSGSVVSYNRTYRRLFALWRRPGSVTERGAISGLALPQVATGRDPVLARANRYLTGGRTASMA